MLSFRTFTLAMYSRTVLMLLDVMMGILKVKVLEILLHA